MSSGRCERFQPDLSAYTDGTLPRRRWEQVSYHLAGCRSCRDEVSAISRVCSTLSACGRSDAPASLAARLESIAGEHAAAPLYMASGSGELPSARQRRNRRVTQGGAALLVAVMSVMVLAVLVAPDPRKLDDAVGAAREQFSRATAAVSVNEALGAVLLAHERGADQGASVSYTPLPADSVDVVISETRAAAWLQAAAEVDETLRGIQRVWVADGEGHFHTADVVTTKVAGRGAQLEVLDVRGDRFGSSFLPVFHRRPVGAPQRLSFTESFGAETVSGRDAFRIRAYDDHGPVASWWLDSQTGLLLWSERYNAFGDVALAFGYTQLAFGDASFSDDAGITQVISLEPATSSQEDGWCVGLEQCPQSVAGLPLVAYSSSEQQDGRSMTLVYSDGVETAVVGWSDGLLGDDVTSRTDRSAGLPTVVTWQCGSAVLSVTSNASPELLAEIAQELPGEQPYSETLTDRAVAGLGRLVGVS